jgi:regulatory protein
MTMAPHRGSQRARQEEATTLPPAERAREIAIRLLTNSPRSAAQLRAGLIARDVEPHFAEEVIARYTEVGLIDDAALAQVIARTRHAERGTAARVIAQELRRKGFSQEHIALALEPITRETEDDTAARLARKRWERTSGMPRDVRVRRVVAHLGRKGYGPGLAFALVKDLALADSEEQALGE